MNKKPFGHCSHPVSQLVERESNRRQVGRRDNSRRAGRDRGYRGVVCPQVAYGHHWVTSARRYTGALSTGGLTLISAHAEHGCGHRHGHASSAVERHRENGIR